MLQRQGKGCREGTSAPPLKKVTFYGPVMTTKGEKLRHVGTKTAPRKRTTFSSLTSTAKGMTLKPTHHKQSKSVVGDQNKPHSKTTVIGMPTMTRLNCNHLRPKCQCSNPSGRKMLSKVKNKSAVSDTPRQILTSTRSLPRGELDGRKSYKENSNSISILDANWRPGLDIFSEDNIERTSANQNSESDIHKERENNDENKENSKKKVQFAEKINRHSGSRKKFDILQNGSNSDTSRRMNNSQRYSKNKDEHPQSQPNNHSTQPESSAKVLDPPVAPSSSYHTQRRNVFSDNNSLTTDSQKQAALKDYCTLCELPDHYSIQTSSNHHDDEYPSEHYTDHLKYSSLYGNEDPCLLCRRYGKQHYYTDDEDQREKYNTDYSHTLTDLNKHIRRSTFHKSRSPLCRKLSTPTLYSDKEEEPVFTRTIPYEPRTELVKNLKQKLEAGYRNHEYEYLPRRSNFRRRWRSWDAEDSDRNSHLHNYSKTWDHSPHHKCIHRYLQNERLFLEPTVMDIEGRSVCVECGEPQPTDPEQDPFLYHITLGGMNGGGLGQNQDKKAWRYQPRIGFTSNKADKHNTYQRTKESSGDTSKHIYAKLNKNINNILPSGPGYFLHPWAASKLRYRADPHVKRHPSKSMALVDHIV